jgi:hypothetical protein
MAVRKMVMISVVVTAGALSVARGQQEPKPPLPADEPNQPWKQQVRLPEDAFLVQGAGTSEPAWVKFTIVLPADGAPTVYFQDGHQYLFHYQFATACLKPFQGMTTEQFDRVTLYRQGRQAVLGAVISPPVHGLSSQPHEYGIQFVGLDPFTKEEALEYFNLIKACVLSDEPFTAYYFPTYEQQAVAEADRAWLEAQGILISSPDRWADDNTCYSPGWAIGTLKYIEGKDIRAAYLQGTLGPYDILLTDGIPAETPFVAGMITLSPSTPNSHVAILATTFGVPFVHLTVAEDVNDARRLVGHEICLRAFDTYGRTDVRLIDLQGILDEATIAEIRALKKPPQLAIAPATPYGSYAMNTDALMPTDICYFGGKAANFGMLRRALPEHTPVAVAFSFDLWNDFLGQKLPDGRTLRETIAAHLSLLPYPPADMAALSSALADLRKLFTDESVTSFTAQQQQAILDILQDPQYGFDASRNLRFRSSTNMEDSLEFTGAGLYDSYSGCLADDLDGDGAGPCRCDPQRDKERGVFRAIRKVFAGFYNDNAYLERLRHDINETDVGMALLVHHSFPDEFELANGVATVARRTDGSLEIELVTQAGATSVTNPPEGSIPEEVTVWVYESGVYPQQVRQSNLVPLGATVLQWEDEYRALADLLARVVAEYADVTGKEEFVLEMEYKKISDLKSQISNTESQISDAGSQFSALSSQISNPTSEISDLRFSLADPSDGAESPSAGRLVVKQVREVPQPDTTPGITPFLVKEPAAYCVVQGQFGDIFAHHRLKSLWQLETGSFWLTAEQLSRSLYEQATFEYMADGVAGRLSGPMSDWPAASHSGGARMNEFSGVEIGWTTEAWELNDIPNPRRYKLHTDNMPTLVSAADPAVLTLRDFGPLTLEVEYAQPVLRWEWTGPVATTTDEVQLAPCPEPSPGDLLQKRVFYGTDGRIIVTSFYWPAPPTGPTAGYTAPLARWVETRIVDFTREPFVLHGYYSQTYKPEHHNFAEHFLFEPQLEPGLSPDVLAELRAKDIRLIHVFAGMDTTTITTYGFHDALPAPQDPNAPSSGELVPLSVP